MDKKTNAGKLLFFLGLLIVTVRVRVDTGISYGFIFGKNEGVKKGGITYLTEQLIGDHLQIDILFPPVGFLLIIIGASLLVMRQREKKKIYLAAVFGMICDLVVVALPFLISQYKLLKPVLLFTALELLCVLVIMYAFMVACKKQVDSYLYMEVGKDLTFATEMYGFAVVCSYVMLFLAGFYVYFAHGGYLLLIAAGYAAVLYYIWKAWHYSKTLHLFGKENSKESEGEK